MMKRTDHMPAAANTPISEIATVMNPAMRIRTPPEAYSLPVRKSRLFWEANRYMPVANTPRPINCVHREIHGIYSIGLSFNTTTHRQLHKHGQVY